MRVMILAAGLGTRMRPLTRDTPKPMLPVGDRPLLEHLVRKLVTADLPELVINTHYLGSQITSHFGDGSAFGASIRWSPEATLLDTGGGVQQALPLLGGAPFALTSADSWHAWDWCQPPTLAADHDIHLVLAPQPDYLPRADFLGNADGVIGAGQVPYNWARIAVLHPRVFRGAGGGAFPLTPLFRRAIEAGRLSTSVYRGAWLDVGTPAQLAELRALRAAGAMD